MANPRIVAEFLFDKKSIDDVVNNLGRGLSEAAKDFAADVKRKVASGMSDGMKLALASGRSGEAIRKFLDTNIIGAAEKWHKLMLEGKVAEAEKIERTLDQRSKRFAREVEAQAEAFEAMSRRQVRTFSESADAFKDSVQEIQAGISSPEGILGLGRGIAGRIQQRGRAEQDRARRIREVDPTQARGMAVAGRAVAGFGGALVAIAAVAGAVMALVKLFMDLNDRIVEMNKAIADTAGIADFGIGGRPVEAGQRFGQELETIRTQITDAASKINGFRVNAQDMFRVLGAMNEANYQFRKMREEIDRGAANMHDYADAAELAITYSKLFGIDLQMVGTNMGDLANDFGVGLGQIAEGLSTVHREAALSGFSTKRFYSTILEATSGMGFYAVRLEEAGKMLKYLSNIMGETAGVELFKSLTNTWTDATTEARLKQILLTGQAETARIFADVAEAEAEGIYADLTKNLSDKNLWEKAGITSGASLVKSLGKMGEEEREKLMAKLKRIGYEPEMVQRMDNLIETIQAGQGDLGQQVEAMGRVGPAATLAMLTQSQVFSGRMLHRFIAEEGAPGRAAAEQVTGFSGKQLDALIDASRATAADLKSLRAIQGRIQSGQQKIANEDMRAMAELYGAVVTQTGEIVGATFDSKSNTVILGKQVTDEQGLMLAQNDRYQKAAGQAVSEDIELARQISQNTEKLSNVLEANIAKILNKIWKEVHDFWMSFLDWWHVFSPEDPGVKGRATVERNLAKTQTDVTNAIEANNKLIQGLQKSREGTQDPILKKGFDDQIEVLAQANEDMRHMGETAERGSEILSHMDTEGMYTSQILLAIEEKMREQGMALEAISPNLSAGYEEMMAMMEDMPDTIENKFETQWTEAAKDFARRVTMASGMTTTQGLRVQERAAEAAGQTYVGETQEQFFERVRDAVGQAMQEASDPTKQLQQEANVNLAEIAVATLDTARKANDLKNLQVFETAQAAKDLILPAGGGRPIITDERDTVMAMRPGGPIATGMAGGPRTRGTVNVNIHGGDQRRIYSTVMRALRATGNA